LYYVLTQELISAAYVLLANFAGAICVTLPNFVAIRQTVAEIW